mmetsp:Transcript_122979/g.348572  ORF Transcript_122979/g.348572 Transcript_122979/m.348572 type:complete len:250 (-) Transcript_122979:790-1539(-)
MRLQPRLLLAVGPLPALPARVALDGDPVRVVQEPLPDQALEDPLAARQAPLQLREGRLEAERLEGVPPVAPALDGGEHDREALGEAPGVQLPVPELDGVDGGLDGVLLEAGLCNLGQRAQNEGFDLRHVLGPHVLQAHAERRLEEPLAEAAADGGGPEAAVDEGLVEGRGRRAQEEVVQERQGEARLQVQLALGDQPRHADHAPFRDVLVLPHLELPNNTPGLLEEALWPHHRIHVHPLELTEKCVQQL